MKITGTKQGAAPASCRCRFGIADGAFLLERARCAEQIGDAALKRQFLELAAKVGEVLASGAPEWPVHCGVAMAADFENGVTVCVWCGERGRLP